MKQNPIYVTQPYLPPLEEFTPYLEQIWANKTLTNGGPCQQHRRPRARGGEPCLTSSNASRSRDVPAHAGVSLRG